MLVYIIYTAQFDVGRDFVDLELRLWKRRRRATRRYIFSCDAYKYVLFKDQTANLGAFSLFFLSLYASSPSHQSRDVDRSEI